MMRQALAFAAATVGLGLVLGGAPRAHATLELQKKAKEAGIAAANCQYCHNEKLPKKDAVSHNDRGKWLLAQKEAKKAKVVDAAWLKDYVEKK